MIKKLKDDWLLTGIILILLIILIIFSVLMSKAQKIDDQNIFKSEMVCMNFDNCHSLSTKPFCYVNEFEKIPENYSSIIYYNNKIVVIK